MDLYKKKYLKYKNKYINLKKNMKGGGYLKVGDNVSWFFKEKSTVVEDFSNYYVCRTDLNDVRIYSNDTIRFIDSSKEKNRLRWPIKVGDRVTTHFDSTGRNKITKIKDNKVTINTEYGNIYVSMNDLEKWNPKSAIKNFFTFNF